MPLQNSGQISLNDLHVEAGGTSGTEASMNDSDIRGLLNASANSQMTFSGFYGASSQLWSVNVTTGGWAFKSTSFRGYGVDFLGSVKGSISDGTIDFINNGNATPYLVNSGQSSFTFTANNVGTDTTNTGFTSVTIHNTTLTRANADNFTYISSLGQKSWFWSSVGNVWGTQTIGTTRTVVFN